MSLAELAADILAKHRVSVPVDLNRIILGEGILLRTVDADPDDFDGMYIRLRGRPVIIINGRQSRVHRRLTIAHELYHHFVWRPRLSLAADPGAAPTTSRSPIYAKRRLTPSPSRFLPPLTTLGGWRGLAQT